MYRDHSVGVVVPAYNEEGFVGDVIDTLPTFVDRAYVIDDRSTDGTWQEILDHVEGDARPPSAVADGGESIHRPPEPDVTSSSLPLVVPIRHEENRGVGAAIKTGYRRALDDGIDLVAVMAGDGQMDPDQLAVLLDPMIDRHVDYAKANRLRSADHWDGMSRFRLFGNAILTLLTKISSGYWELLDPQNGYTVISRSAIEAVDLERTYDDYGFTNDLLARLNRHDLRVAHVDIPAEYGDETSHISYPSYTVNVSKLLLSNFLWRLKHKYVLGSFHPFVMTYLLGTVVSTVGLLAVFGSVVGLLVGATGGLPLLLSAVLFAVGGGLVLSAMETEASLNADLEVQVT